MGEGGERNRRRDRKSATRERKDPMGLFTGYADFLRISVMYLLRLRRLRTAAKASFR